jgi:hypothetical protein
MGGGTPDLKVDYDLLGEFQRNLTFVHDEFAGLGKEVHSLDSASGWGHQEISSAMDDFERNWSYHRGKLESAIEALLTMVQQTQGTFQEGDQQLAKALHTDTDGPSSAAKGGR